jgi:hypothetical protein
VEVTEDLRKAYDEGLINPGFITWEEITEELAKGPHATLARVKDRYKLINGGIEEIEWWPRFHEDEEGFAEDEDSLGPQLEDVECWSPMAEPNPEWDAMSPVLVEAERDSRNAADGSG